MKSPVWIGLFIGSAIGNYLPTLWGISAFSLTGILFSALGGIAGIWIGYRFLS